MPCRQLTARAENAVRKQLSVGRLCPAAALLQQQTLVGQSWLYTAELTQLRGCGGTCTHTLGAPVSKGRNCKWKEGLSPGRTLWRRSYLILRWPLSTFVPAFQYRLVTGIQRGGAAFKAWEGPKPCACVPQLCEASACPRARPPPLPRAGHAASA